MFNSINNYFTQPFWECTTEYGNKVGFMCGGRCCAFCNNLDRPSCPHYGQSYPSHPCPPNHIEVCTPAPDMGDGWMRVDVVPVKPFWVGR